MIHLSRRDVLKATAGFSALAAVQKAYGQANPRRIDVHNHYAPRRSREPRRKRTTATLSGRLRLALEQMDQHGIETTIFSRPGGESEEGGEKARTFCRKNNEYIAKVVSDNPKRFGFFAVIPYSDTEGAMKELEYAYEP